MKRQLCSFVLTGLLAAGVVAAQQPGSAPEQAPSQAEAAGIGGHQDGDRSKKLEKRLAHMTKRYKLTLDQQSQLKSIVLKEQRDIQTVNSDTFMSRENKRNELVDLHEASQRRIASILNDRQRHKFAIDEEHRAWMDGRLPEPNPGPALGSW